MEIPIVRFIGDSGSGKTTLMAGVIKILVRKGYRVGAIKHSSGFPELDTPGKDSFKMKDAGAERVLLASKENSVLFHQHPTVEPDVSTRLQFFQGFDIVFVESWKSQNFPSVEVKKGKSQDPEKVAAWVEKKLLKGV